MKKLVLIKSYDEFLSSEASDSKFYGVKLRLARGVVTRGTYNGGPFTVVSLSHFTNGNGWNYLGKNTLEETLERLFEKGFEVCEFDTFLEMAQWLSE